MTPWATPALKTLFKLHKQICKTGGIAAADKIISRIYESANHLETFPKLGRSTELHGIRDLIVPGTPYIIRYRLRGSKPEVVDVKHGKQNY